MWRQRIAQRSQAERNSAASAAIEVAIEVAAQSDQEKAPALPRHPAESIKYADIFQHGIRRQLFDLTDLQKSTRFERLLPIHKNALMASLYKEQGLVSSAMIVQCAEFLGLTLDFSVVEAILTNVDSKKNNEKTQFSEQKGRTWTVVNEGSDSDSEPDPDQKPNEKPSDELSHSQIVEIVYRLKRGLFFLHRETLQRQKQKELKTAEETAKLKKDIPSYTQEKVIADTLVDFNRMTRTRLFGSRISQEYGSATSQHSVTLSHPTMSVAHIEKDDNGSTSAASLSTIGESEAGHSTAAPSVVSVRSVSVSVPVSVPVPVSVSASVPVSVSVSASFHPLKSPDVFRHFYPSTPSEETKKLPIFSQFEGILSMLKTRKVTIISGRTGTGKTTQVPLMILDECALSKKPCNIIVTQPRRLAAIGVARRVCTDRGWSVGQLVGYHMGLDKCVSQSTRLTYCTTGVLIQKLVAEKHLNTYTHIFLDEVHERDQDTDMALMLVRQMQRENSPDVKVVLMSATVEVQKMIQYFHQNRDTLALADHPGRINIETGSHEVYEKFLDEFAEQSNTFEFDMVQPKLSHKLLDLAVRMLDSLDPIIGVEVALNRAVLVFLPGLEHIMEMADLIKVRAPETEVMILHSTVSSVEQEKVLLSPSAGVRRVILSTNIAESSLTIPYIDYVFDFCLTKTLRLNRRTKVPQLSLEWASVSNCQQRKGRVGRVRKGRIYFFVPRKFFSEELLKHPEPEILISPLENCVLRVKMLKVLPPPAEVLILLPDPPKRNDVEMAVLTLKEVGALTVKFNGQPSYTDGDLTVMGHLMTRFPMDIRISKFLILCCLFGYVQEGVTIACGLSIESVISNENVRSVCSVRSVRSAERCRRLNALYTLGVKSDTSPSHPGVLVKSDAVALLCAFERWTKECDRGSFGSRLDERRWCQSQLLDVSRMKEFVALRREVWHRLSDRSVFCDEPSKNSVARETFLPFLLAGAFFPNILVNYNAGSDVVKGKELLGYDPLHTCVIRKFGYGTACQAPLYDAQLKRILELNTSADSVARIIYGHRETFISFTRHSGNIALIADYSSHLHPGLEILNKRVEGMRGTLHLHDQGESSQLRLSTTATDVINSDFDSRFCVSDNTVRLPPPDIPSDKIPVVIADIENVELFWLANWTEENQRRQMVLNNITTKLADRRALRPVRAADLLVLSSYLARHRDSDNEFARVTLLGPPDRNGNVQVSLVDCGMVDRIPTDWLYVLPPAAQTVPRASFEFRFVGLRFITSKKPAAVQYIRNFVSVEEAQLTLQVHSIIDGVVHGVIYWTSPVLKGETVNLNEEMIKLGFAYQGVASWIAEYDHKRRLNGPVVQLPSSYDAVQKDVPQTTPMHNLIQVGPLQFPARVCLQTIDRRRMMVGVEPGSLNAFVYDKHGEDGCWPYRSLVTSRLVHSDSKNVSRNVLKAYSTTVLPTQPGLLAILTMVFAPYVELIEHHGEYVGALTGLGPFPGKTHSFFPDCEVELPFDGEVTTDDVTKVNNLRAKMNAVLKLIGNENADVDVVASLQTSCVQTLTGLLNKPRRLKPFRNNDYKWSTTDHDHTDEAAASTFLVPVEAPPLPDESNQDKFANVVALHHSLAQHMAGNGLLGSDVMESRCILCNTQLSDADMILFHLYSKEHLVKERTLLCLSSSLL